jgi:hypothetical protein
MLTQLENMCAGLRIRKKKSQQQQQTRRWRYGSAFKKTGKKGTDALRQFLQQSEVC